ncbi:MAG TPA: hypothetical protein VHQ90_19165 [Thermoanaerobaculia bacterium]|nr:hypothetical protein [Thermoanaerobaculia bacterium]
MFLARLGASPSEAAELMAYNENAFDLGALGRQMQFPLPDEPFVAFWQALVEECRTADTFAVLQKHLPQLCFPIREGISATAGYRAATRQGLPPGAIPEATGLELERSEEIEVVLHPSAAGRIPLLIARRRKDFVSLVRALAKRNEPEPVLDSQGALMVSGYNNWSRIGELRRRWEALPPGARESATWGEELARIKDRRDLYQDRFILLSDGPYSAVPARELGLDDASWREMSLVLRREHECAHYLTRRLFGSMRNNVLDELIADYAGMVGSAGRFRAAWFLRFLGIEEVPRPGHQPLAGASAVPSTPESSPVHPTGRDRASGRLDLYRGKPSLSDGAFRLLQLLIQAAAVNLERFDARRPAGPLSPQESTLAIAALASLRLNDLAATGADAVLAGTVEELRRRCQATQNR